MRKKDSAVIVGEKPVTGGYVKADGAEGEAPPEFVKIERFGKIEREKELYIDLMWQFLLSVVFHFYAPYRLICSLEIRMHIGRRFRAAV